MIEYTKTNISMIDWSFDIEEFTIAMKHEISSLVVIVSPIFPKELQDQN